MLGAALNHSALNLANALGAWLGGLVIAAGLGYRAPSVVGAGLAAAGLVPLAVSAVLRRRRPAAAAVAAAGARRRAGARARGLTGCNPAATLPRPSPANRADRPGIPGFSASVGLPRAALAARRRGKPGLTAARGDRLRRVARK